MHYLLDGWPASGTSPAHWLVLHELDPTDGLASARREVDILHDEQGQDNQQQTNEEA
ncbi:MAG TPA: hypothetical protein VNA25_28570 [Phycisphaerae bacterium]|nr:hypothetical protein [Phycisphaerae bacterium]